MSNTQKQFQELTFIDNFMFITVMQNPKNSKKFLEILFGVPIDRVEINGEHALSYHPKHRGVRLDVFIKDENNTRYNIELQESIDEIKQSREMGEVYMGLKEWLEDEFEDGRAIGIEEGRAVGIVEGKAAGIAEGKAAGIAESRASLVKKKLAKGISIEEIADFLEEDISVIKAIAEDLKS